MRWLALLLLPTAFERDVLVIEASRYACLRFDIYLAVTPEQQRRGLMHVRNLPARTGMLFVYSGDNHPSMWMKNTFISLDILFAHADGRVSSIVRSTEPRSLSSISSTDSKRNGSRRPPTPRTSARAGAR